MRLIIYSLIGYHNRESFEEPSQSTFFCQMSSIGLDKDPKLDPNRRKPKKKGIGQVKMG